MKIAEPIIAVVGAGRMGTGIAQVFAYSGYKVELIDIKERPATKMDKALKSAANEIAANLSFLSSLNVLQESSINGILGRIGYHYAAQTEEVLAKADVVFEAVPEVLDLKRKVFYRISSIVNPKTLIASTTSSFSANVLAEYVENPERFLNTHWLNPAYLIPIVEVSSGERTSGLVLEEMVKLLEMAGKIPVKCSASPGFIVPRIQALAMNEAARLIEEGVGMPEDIDKATRLGFGLRFAVLGMLEFIDWGGGDILYYASNSLKDALKDERFAPPAIIKKNMEDGNTGLKTGQGFYNFNDINVQEYKKETLTKFVNILRYLDILVPPAL
ncbi:3-hydroxybutyryl-CoA dehydrogenase [Paradesulfitobacterium ferrireducens]|uniref:3-hydroxybutyryl-CoA dehydrogenase n=1 Tax=Paradesulfitobacterium ferrireducens TaxID=2816476 RepID=UPI001A8DD2B1|nr:3-hydroxybutyryl-CoA dehydrogenase [Paradesulfitobacterium ferrireducens]